MARRVFTLIAASALLAGLLEGLGLPAGLLLGPMAVGIVMATTGHGVAIPDIAFHSGQAMVGLLVASAMTASIVEQVWTHPLLFGGVTLATLSASALIGWLLSRWHVLPGSVAVLGSMPGAATAMVLMARSFGADPQLVAVMTYSRVVCVALVASVLTAALGGSSGSHAPGIAWFPTLHALAFAQTLAVAAIGAWLGVRFKVPAGALIGPMALGAVLNVGGLLELELPGWLLAASYAVVGWKIGLGFTREIVSVATKAFPRLLLSIGALLGFSFGIALVLAQVAGIDLATAYLATSPGGMDSIAIIAASTPVDVPFVMALQLLRFLAVLLAGPPFARFIARRYRGDAS